MLKKHLQGRNFNVNLYPLLWIDEGNERITFPLWNLSGKLVGFQQYTPSAGKKAGDNKRDQRYFIYVTKVNKKVELAVWGLEKLNPKIKRIYLVEGIFKACRFHNYGLNSLAVLGNNPKQLKTWLFSLGYELISLCDGDRAGQALTEFGHSSMSLCKDEYLDDLTEPEFSSLLRQLEG